MAYHCQANVGLSAALWQHATQQRVNRRKQVMLAQRFRQRDLKRRCDGAQINWPKIRAGGKSDCGRHRIERPACAQMPDHPIAGDERHVLIHDHQIKPLGQRGFHGFAPIRSNRQLDVNPKEERLNDALVDLVILGQQDLEFGLWCSV